MDDGDPEQPIPGLNKNNHPQNRITSYLQLRTHAAGSHADQPDRNRARTNNDQEGVQTFDPPTSRYWID